MIEVMSLVEILAKKHLKNGVELKNKLSLPPPQTSLAFIESLTMPLVQKVVISADVSCKECQKKVNDLISRMTETESVEVDVMEKKVTVICTYPSCVQVTARRIPSVYRKPLRKVALIKRILSFSSR
ncbi:hypothetical protein Nepgr_029357 [Nepenthes gracilis]|uniref:HMA domain-containing protein n=1 Tax=Nepenthes gracilis TaxID=150966 RepID=A0AAD3TEE6_NEPGR|nr:hypothetical protein Nepgr_029357 [Nepenthes gracilis]